MSDREFWSTGIQLKWRYDRWFATCDYQTFVFGDSENDLCGTLSAKYGFADPLVPVKIIIDAAKRLGIVFKGPGEQPSIYIEQDGEGDVDLPDDWRRVAWDVAREVGFTSHYKITGVE